MGLKLHIRHPARPSFQVADHQIPMGNKHSQNTWETKNLPSSRVVPYKQQYLPGLPITELLGEKTQKAMAAWTQKTSQLTDPSSAIPLLQPHASLAKCDITTGRVPCLNQSNDLASLDLSVLFLILPVNTSASTGPPYSKLVGFIVLRCFAMQPCKEQDLY